MKKNGDNKSSKQFLGVPMNWDRKNAFKNLWNKEDDRLFPPKTFGIGWTINFHAVCKRIGLVSFEKKSKK